MEQVGNSEAIEVVTRRVDFLEVLSDTPRRKPELVDVLDHSRSTVDRAIRTLEDAGLVERTDDGYATTVAGRLAAARYRAFLEDERDVLAAHEAIAPLPASCDVPIEMLSSASVETGEGEHWLFERLGELLRSADRYRVALPRLVDSRHLRLCGARAERGALDVTILAASDVLVRCREEFPRLAVGLADCDSVDVRACDAPPYGILSVERDGGSTTVALVTYDDDGVAGFVRNDSESAIEWTRERLDALASDSRDASDDLGEVDVTSDVFTFAQSERRFSPTLRSQGFVRVDADFLDRRDPLDPETGWRAGLGLSEVAAGYAVERERESDDGRVSVLDDLQALLRDGSAVALLGPPGSGKSTLCKQVAVRWYEAEDGAVLYRESGGGQAFDAVGALESAIQSDPGQTLIVVEDAVRSEANAIFDVMQAVSGRDDVAFLLDARESEWHDPDSLPIDARLEAFRQEAIETVTMPPLDETESRRLIERFE